MQLISAGGVLSQAFLPQERISVSSIRPIKIDISEQRYIRPRFGDTLFDEFKEGLHATFVSQYIAPALSHYVRASIIDELSIQISDQGAIIYDESYKTQNDKQETSKSDETVDTTTTSNDTETTEENSTNKTTLMEEIDTKATNSYTTTTPVTNAEYCDELISESQDTESTENETGTLSSQTSGNSSNVEKCDTTAESSELTSEKESKETLRAATAEERQVLIMRALDDANILMAKAVRYVEKNPDEFPSYEPMNLSRRVFF